MGGDDFSGLPSGSICGEHWSAAGRFAPGAPLLFGEQWMTVDIERFMTILVEEVRGYQVPVVDLIA
ncbi:MAG TPA: hypothetical protein VLA15_06975, partial [Desulfurivibrionaceae bacterium]|nr:hypothetical protein [Desulfurivibrionaceae bacterium]